MQNQDLTLTSSEFQGARYEIAVAATFVRGGCRVKFISDKTRKHCEFVARDLATGATIAVEAKSRHRPGVLGFRGEVDEARAIRGDVEDLVDRALKQNPGDLPFMIFVDLNCPPVAGVPVEEQRWFEDIWDFMRSLPTPTPERPDEFNSIFLTNYSYHWLRTESALGGSYLAIHSRWPTHPLPVDVVGRIGMAVHNYGHIPREP